MKPLLHCKSSVKKWGGVVDDYMPIHEFFDQTKAHVADVRHRAILHNSFGIYLCQQVFGHYFVNSDGKEVSVRDVGEQHVLEDLGTIPSLDKCFESFPKTVVWTQYTPYFNDGDACVFRVNEPSFSSNLPEDIEEIEYYGDGDPEDGWLHTYGDRSDNPAYDNLEKKLQEIDTLLESLGDHSQLFVANYPDGIKVTVESYDHD